ncbi:hypothetical protein [Streptomyces sp. NPDC050738]|uniref:DUF7927 domain-containing protein n=1 Tax=Streptomyces sp. NPDC050738 TaxID=3154744 RepID=UPI003435358F
MTCSGRFPDKARLWKLGCVLALVAVWAIGAVLPSEAAPRAAGPLTIVKDAKVEAPYGTGFNVRPGGTVTYIVRVTNNGSTEYTGAVVKDDLTGVLDDATYNHDATARSGSFAFSEPTLTWSGDVPAGRTVVLTYSVTVDDPGHGDFQLTNTVVGPDDSNCAAGSTSGSCRWRVVVSELAITKTSDVSEAEPGDRVTYTVRVDSNGYSGATDYDQILRDDLTGALDDATYNHDAKVVSGPGRVVYSKPTLTLFIAQITTGESTVLTYSMTVKDPATGDGTMNNTVADPRFDNLSNCQGNTEGTGCSADVTVTEPSLVITKTSDADGSVSPGDTVHYKITVSNPGTGDYRNATFTDPLSGVLDDAVYNGDAKATSGSVTYGKPNLGWAGDVPAGKTVTLTYSATVDDPDKGDMNLDNAVVSDGDGANCLSGSGDPRCSTHIKVTQEPAGGPTSDDGTVPSGLPEPSDGQLADTGESHGTQIAGIAVLVLTVGGGLALAAARSRRAQR